MRVGIVNGPNPTRLGRRKPERHEPYRFHGADTQDLFKEQSEVYVCGLGHEALHRLHEIATTRRNA